MKNVYFCGMNQELENILSKVSQMYLRFGIKSITMDDVSRELAISKKTLYQFFEDKSDLVHKVIDYLIAERGKTLEGIASRSANAIEELIEMNRFVVGMMREHSPACDFDLKKYYPDCYQQIRQIKRSRMYNILFGNILRGKEENLYRKDLDAEIIARLYVNLVESMMESDIFTIEELISKKMYFEMFVYHIRGIANAEGVAYFERKQEEFHKTI